MTRHKQHVLARRRVAAALATLLAVVSLTVAVPAPAQAAVYSGAISAAYADNPLPRLSETAGVHFVVSLPLVAARVTIVDENGKTLWTYSKGTDCGYGSNPAPGETKTYTAHLTVQANGAWVEVATASVSVTDPGFSSGFTSAYADNPTPKLSESTHVTFMLEAPMDVVASAVAVYDEHGTKVASCGSANMAKDRCVVGSNPAPGETKTYTAHLTAQGVGAWFEVATASVSVTDPGWQGTVSASASNHSFVDPGASTTVSFDVSEPLESAQVKLYVDGVYQRTCSTIGQTTCGIAVQFAEAMPHVVTASVEAQRALGREVVSSASQVVTTQTAQQFADWLLNPATDLGELGTPELLETLAALRSGVDIAEACYKAGVLIPEDEEFHGSPADVTLACDAAGLTARDFLVTLFAAVGVAGAFAVVNEVVIPVVTDPVPTPQPEPPTGGGGSTTDPGDTGGGGTADNTPGGDTTWYLGSKTAGAVTYAEEAPYAWTPELILCQVQTTDPQTSEPMTVELDAKQLAHLIDEHLANVPDEKSRWDDIFREGVNDVKLQDFENQLLPEDFQRLIAFICRGVLAGTPASYGNSTSPTTPDNKVWTYQFSSEVTTGMKGSLDTEPGNLVTVYIAPDGRVQSAHPGSTKSE